MSLVLEQSNQSVIPAEADLPDFGTAPLLVVTATKYLKHTENHPRRLLQIPDAQTVDYLYRQFGETGPQSMTIAQLWEALGAPKPFQSLSWDQMQRYFGTPEMYTDPNHQPCIHGDGHQDRVTLYSAILGQYKGLTEAEMKVLLVAASIHDRARVNDRIDIDHGKRAAHNFTQGDPEKGIKPYLDVYRQRGIEFTEKEIMQIELLCLYHEMPWEKVVQFDERTNLLIQILQAADGADRYRSPNPDPNVGWWPKPEFFMNFFEGDRQKVDAFLAFTAYFTLSSEKERFDRYKNPRAHVEDALKGKAIEVGIVRNQTSWIDTAFGYLGRVGGRRSVPYGSL